MTPQKMTVLRILGPPSLPSAFQVHAKTPSQSDLPNGIRPLQYTFDPATIVLEEDGDRLKLTQLGTLENPTLPPECQAFTSLHCTLLNGPPVNLLSLFQLSAMLPRLKTFRYSVRKPPSGHSAPEGDRAQRLSQSSVERLEILVDLTMYTEAGREKKERIRGLVRDLLRMAAKNFPNISKIRLELPADGPEHEMYRAVWDLTHAYSRLKSQVEILVDVGKSKLTCFHTSGQSSRMRRGSQASVESPGQSSLNMRVSPNNEDSDSSLAAPADGPVTHQFNLRDLQPRLFNYPPPTATMPVGNGPDVEVNVRAGPQNGHQSTSTAPAASGIRAEPGPARTPNPPLRQGRQHPYNNAAGGPTRSLQTREGPGIFGPEADTKPQYARRGRGK